MSQRTKKQHIVPRFYLDKFTDKDGFVWTYSEDAPVRAAKPQDTAVETNFYTPIGDDGERFDGAEDFLAEIESNAAPLWDLFQSGETITGTERDHLSVYLAAQYLRSPSSVNASAELLGGLANHTARITASNKSNHNKSLDAYEKDTGVQISPDEREEMREFFNDTSRYKIDVLRSTGLMALGAIPEVADFFFEMNWAVGHSEHQHLITSDNPVTRICDPSTVSPFRGDGGLRNKTVQIQFPLSPNRLLEMTWKGKARSGLIAVPKNFAKAANRLRALQAERFVYGNQRDTGIEKLCSRHLKERTTPRFKSNQDTPEINVRRKF